MRSLLLLCLGVAAYGQFAQPVQFVTSDPTGACVFGVPVQWNGTDHLAWGCGSDSAWHQVNTGALTPGSVPFAGSNGILTQDNAKLNWNDAQGILYITANSGAPGLYVTGSSGNPGYININNTDGTHESSITFMGAGSAKWQEGLQTNGDFFMWNQALTKNFLDVASSDGRVTIQPSGGNTELCGTVQDNYALSVQCSGSSGTFRVFDQTPSTGNTLQVFQEGAGQGAADQYFLNNTGTVLAEWFRGGSLDANYLGVWDSGYTIKAQMTNTGGFEAANGFGYLFSSSSAGNGSVDAAILRSAAGLLEVDNGTSGMYRDMFLRNLYQPLTTPASSSATCTQGAFEFDANYVYVCTATNTWKRSALSTF
jgi:hypothetical protein